MCHRVSRRFGNLLNRPKPHIEVRFTEDHGGPVNTYSTFDKINGTVTISAPARQDVGIDSMEIAFVGKSPY